MCAIRRSFGAGLSGVGGNANREQKQQQKGSHSAREDIALLALLARFSRALDRIVARLRLFFEFVSITIAALELTEEIQLFIVFQADTHGFRVFFDH